jgi:hypothetical protein
VLRTLQRKLPRLPVPLGHDPAARARRIIDAGWRDRVQDLWCKIC